MKWLILIILALVVYRWVSKIKRNVNLFLENYEIAIIDKEDVEREGTHTDDILKLRPESYDKSMDILKTANADILMGHLEINGFAMNAGNMVCEGGWERQEFKRFEITSK